MKIVQLHSALTENNNYKFCILSNMKVLQYTLQMSEIWDFQYLQDETYNTIGDLIR